MKSKNISLVLALLLLIFGVFSFQDSTASALKINKQPVQNKSSSTKKIIKKGKVKTKLSIKKKINKNIKSLSQNNNSITNSKLIVSTVPINKITINNAPVDAKQNVLPVNNARNLNSSSTQQTIQQSSSQPTQLSNNQNSNPSPVTTSQNPVIAATVLPYDTKPGYTLEIANYTITNNNNEDIKIGQLTLNPTLTSNSCSNFTNGQDILGQITVHDSNSGDIAWYPNGIVSAGGCKVNMIGVSLGSSLILKKGSSDQLSIWVNVKNSNLNVPTDLNISPNLSIPSKNGMIGVSSYLTNTDDFTFPQENNSVTTNINPVQFITVTNNNSQQNIPVNTSSAIIGTFTIQNNSTTESISINGVNLGLLFAGSQTINNLNNIGIKDSSGSYIGNPENPMSNGNNFIGNFTLNPGSSKTINVMADIGSVNTGTIQSTILFEGQFLDLTPVNGTINTIVSSITN